MNQQGVPAMANEGLCDVMSVEQVPESPQDLPSAEDLQAIAATWQQTAGMSAAEQLCSIEVKTSQNSSSISCSTFGGNASESAQGTSASYGKGTRISSVRVPRRTLKIATGERAKAVCEKLANQTTQCAGCNALADTVQTNPAESEPSHNSAQTLLPSDVPELPLAKHRV
jgi:hypothetical protein